MLLADTTLCQAWLFKDKVLSGFSSGKLLSRWGMFTSCIPWLTHEMGQISTCIQTRATTIFKALVTVTTVVDTVTVVVTALIKAHLLTVKSTISVNIRIQVETMSMFYQKDGFQVQSLVESHWVTLFKLTMKALWCALSTAACVPYVLIKAFLEHQASLLAVKQVCVHSAKNMHTKIRLFDHFAHLHIIRLSCFDCVYVGVYITLSLYKLTHSVT